MSIVEKLNKYIDIRESVELVGDAHQLSDLLKSFLRRKFGDRFVKVLFDKTENSGSVFVKYASHPWQSATNEDLMSAPFNFIISINGFNPDGSCDECSLFDVDMYQHKLSNGVRKIRSKKFYTVEEVKKHVLSYFERHYNEFTEDVGAGTSSGAAGFGTGGVERTEGDIAVRPIRMGTEKRRKEKNQ